MFGRKLLQISLAVSLAAAAHAAPSGAEQRLRVVTYNVAMGYFLKAEKKAPFLSLSDTLARHPQLRGVDVLGTQEICGNDGGRQIRYFEEFFRKQYGAAYSAFRRSDPNDPKDCETGQAIFSRYPIEDWGWIQLPQIRAVGKILLWATLKVGDRPVRVYNIHPDNRGKSLLAEEGRWTQVQVALEHAQEYRATHPNDAVIFLGDFNALGNLVDIWRPEKSIVEMKKHFTATEPGYTPTYVTGWHLDWIFFDRIRLIDSKTVRILFSDHFPVVADFSLPQ